MTTKYDPVLIDVPVPIVTPRLILRPVAPGDGAVTHEAKVETWDDLCRWMPWTRDGLGTPDDDEIMIRKNHAKFILREDIMLYGFERETNRFVIATGLHRFCWRARRFEIGYWVRKSAHNKGYATESTNALTRYAFDALNANRVEITHSADNHASKRVIEKLGFEHDAVFRKHHCLPDSGALADLCAYSRLSKDGLPPLDVRWGPP